MEQQQIINLVKHISFSICPQGIQNMAQKSEFFGADSPLKHLKTVWQCGGWKYRSALMAT